MNDLLSPTAQILFQKYGKLTLRLNELAVEMNFANDKAIHGSISAGTFPVHTYKLGRFRVCDIRDLAEYLDQQRGA